MKSTRQPQFFYQFLGAHSLLIGLLPFFLPVYLWKHGLGLAGLSLLIGVSGIAFALALGLWQRWSARWPLRRLVTLTFTLEVALVFVVGIFTTVPGMQLFAQSSAEHIPTASLVYAACAIGVFNGLYNAFFWTSQRTLFLKTLGQNDTGKQYGNFQIFVTLFLKAGILIGGLLLDSGGFVWLLAFSAGISGASAFWLSGADEQTNRPLLAQPASVKARHCFFYKDTHGSQSVFAIDGIFLYLESHFWTLSLFLIVNEDFTALGVTVVLLTIAFAVLFFFIKNTIDRLPIERLYRAAVILYTFSWLLRLSLDDESQGTGLLSTLVVITFFTTFFRLAFNKRFFDVARNTGAVNYLLVKSYSSQCVLGVFFLALGSLLFLFAAETKIILQAIYLSAALLSLLYLTYRDHKPGIA